MKKALGSGNKLSNFSFLLSLAKNTWSWYTKEGGGQLLSDRWLYLLPLMLDPMLSTKHVFSFPFVSVIEFLLEIIATSTNLYITQRERAEKVKEYWRSKWKSKWFLFCNSDRTFCILFKGKYSGQKRLPPGGINSTW